MDDSVTIEEVCGALELIHTGLLVLPQLEFQVCFHYYKQEGKGKLAATKAIKRLRNCSLQTAKEFVDETWDELIQFDTKAQEMSATERVRFKVFLNQS